MTTEVSAESTAGSPGSSRMSPPTARVVRILDFLASRPSEQFSLADLSRNCEVSKPTCLGIVSELCGAGYVTRNSADKTYRLGARMIALGAAAQRGRTVSPAVREELTALSARFSAVCASSAVIGDEIVVTEVVTAPGLESPARVGQTFPYAPPVGILYLMWQSDAELDRWLTRKSVLPAEVDRDRLVEVLAVARSRGYVVERLSREQMRLHAVLAGASAHDLPPDVRQLLAQMAAGVGEGLYFTSSGLDLSDGDQVNLIAAPTFDVNGRQTAVVTMYVDRTTVVADAAELGDALVASARRITESVGGRDPFVSLRGTRR
ncbi:IclR family transcriptional regulator [Gordonia neofelifaecis]|uniref:IclR family transcriptional regulator n=1 Tax=Gordonia neofelifaecis NRRL B-59395 TaxID=644548 RepID=F1YIA6_9ACTN|nr:helix-turn-helix domain-containing protein [Gordonia neofelifaecis]EGD55660.1 IclR family transcriptional regulator [Gordonia neofelifaecis NRRL B-59395]